MWLSLEVRQKLLVFAEILELLVLAMHIDRRLFNLYQEYNRR
jgi:hypothetical protein